MFLKTKKFNICFDADEGLQGGGNTEPVEPVAVEVPEYINNYANNLEEGEQKEYILGMLKDEKGVNALKSFVKDPSEEWNIDTTAYKEKIQGVDEFVDEMKNGGYSKETAEKLINQRISYLENQKSLMSEEEKAAEKNILNFIDSEKNEEYKVVYERMAENAVGRRVLLEFMSLKAGGKTPGAVSGNTGMINSYNHDSFIEEYNIAYDSKDVKKLKELERFARSIKEQDSFYSDFLML